MSAKCTVCKKAIVSKNGQICIACQMKQSNGHAEITSIPSAPTLTEKKSLAVNGTVAENEYKGTIHNFHQTQMKQGILRKWFLTVFYGIPFAVSSDIQYEFSLYEEGNVSGGIRGHEVVLYGNAGYTLLSDNNSVCVKGKKDRNGVIVASEVVSINTGFIMRPRMAIPAMAVRIGTLSVLGMILVALFLAGNSEKPASTTLAVSGNYDNVMITVIFLLCAVVVAKTHIRRKMLYASLLVLFGLGIMSPVFFSFFLLLLAGMYFMNKHK